MTQNGGADLLKKHNHVLTLCPSVGIKAADLRLTGFPMASRAYSIPNLLTYGRILAVPVIVLCFYVEGKLESSDFARWTALWLFIIASLTDFLDGYLARIWNQTSNIGRMLDPIADKLLVASVLLLMAADGTIAGWSLWAAITILCREILVYGLLWLAAALTMYTGYDYFKAGLKHIVDEE